MAANGKRLISPVEVARILLYSSVLVAAKNTHTQNDAKAQRIEGVKTEEGWSNLE